MNQKSCRNSRAAESNVGSQLHISFEACAGDLRRRGYPERFAMEALGHNSMAVHRAYAKNAQVKLPALEEYEKASPNQKVVPFPTQQRVVDELTATR